jgi:hypothetical protein
MGKCGGCEPLKLERSTIPAVKFSAEGTERSSEVSPYNTSIETSAVFCTT